MNISWIVLDLGGPVLHEDIFDRHAREMFHGIATKHGATATRDDVDKIWRKAIDQHSPSITEFVAWEVSKKNARVANAMERDFQAAFKALPPDRLIELFPPTSGMEGVLPALASDYSLALVGNEGAWVRKILEKHKMTGFFKQIVLAEDAGFRKPDTRFFEAVLKKAGCPANEAVVVGDTICMDVFPAKLLGLATVRHHVGYAAWQEARGTFELPDKVLDSMEELPGVLEELKEEM